jgi:hypothetical protein
MPHGCASHRFQRDIRTIHRRIYLPDASVARPNFGLLTGFEVIFCGETSLVVAGANRIETPRNPSSGIYEINSVFGHIHLPAPLLARDAPLSRP